MTEGADGELLDAIYGAAVQPSLWLSVMEGLTDRLGGTCAFISRLDVLSGTGSVITARVDPAMVDLYFAHYASINPLNNVDDAAAYMRGWTPRILTDEDWMPKEALLRTEYYNDFMLPQEVHSVMMIRLAAKDRDVSVMNINRGAARGYFESGDHDLAARLHPHLIRAFRLGELLAAKDSMRHDLAAILDDAPVPVVLVDGGTRVRHLNCAAERLIARGGELTVINSRLCAREPGAAGRLWALIASAASADGQRRSGGSMTLAGSERGLPLAVTVTPARSPMAGVLGVERSVIVTIIDPEARVSVSEQRLRDVFGLSRAESRVALALFEGLTPKQAAASLCLSFFTVRGHLVRIFEKTRTNRQSELLRLMMHAVGGE